MDALAQIDPGETETLDEQSLRLRLDEASLKALAPAPARTSRVQLVFFDTGDFDLTRQGMSLQLRKTGRSGVLTLRGTALSLEVRVPGHEPLLAAFGPEAEAAIAGWTGGAALLPLAGASLKRQESLRNGVRLTLETGTLTAAGRRVAVAEAGLSGPAAMLYEAALGLNAKHHLVLQPETLAARALRLAGAPAPKAQKAAPGPEGQLSLDEAVQQIVQACLGQFAANWAVFEAGDKTSAVHQMRVSMRRLRSALGLFNRALPTPDFNSLREEAKRLAGTMGEARNWDVFAALVQDGLLRGFPAEPGFAGLLAQAETARLAGYAEVKALLADPATTRFLLTAQSFAARRGWRGGLPVEALPILAAPAQEFGAQSLERLYRKVRKRGRNLAALTPHDRHLVRIELKKLRYAAEFFGGLFSPRGRVRAFNEAAAGLQEELGKLNDMATAETLAARLQAANAAQARAIGILLGWSAHAALGDARALQAAWKEFRAARLFSA